MSEISRGVLQQQWRRHTDMAEANIVADRPHNREMHHLNRKGIPWMDLTDLSLADIVETVPHAKKLDQLPPDCRPPSTLSSTMSRPLMPRRIPISSSTSTLSRLARLAASRIPISALKCPQSSTNGLSTSTQGGGISKMLFSQCKNQV